MFGRQPVPSGDNCVICGCDIPAAGPMAVIGANFTDMVCVGCDQVYQERRKQAGVNIHNLPERVRYAAHYLALYRRRR